MLKHYIDQEIFVFRGVKTRTWFLTADCGWLYTGDTGGSETLFSRLPLTCNLAAALVDRIRMWLAV